MIVTPRSVGSRSAQEVEKVLKLGPTVAAISKRSWRRRLRKPTFRNFRNFRNFRSVVVGSIYRPPAHSATSTRFAMSRWLRSCSRLQQRHH
jgi:hypothetical protein